MKKFAYEVIDATGKTVKATMEARTRAEVAESLQAKGYTVVHINEDVLTGLEMFGNINIGGIPLSEKVVFMRQLATMISAGLPLTQALEILASQAKNGAFRNSLTEVLKDVQAGRQLSEGLARQKGVFDRVQISLIKSGEESGNLIEIIQRLADDMEKGAKFKAKVRGAMIYPAIILTVIVVVIVLLMTFMVPTVTGLFDEFGADLPTATKIIIGVSDFTVNYWWILLVSIVALVAGGIYYRSTPSGRDVTDDLLLKLPIFGQFSQKSGVALLARTLQMLLSSGIPILDGLEITKGAMNNVHYKRGLEEAREAVEKGSALAVPLAKNERFPLLLSRMIAVGEETGKVDEVLDKIASYYENEVDQMADNLTKMMEPVMLIAMGLIVGFIALAVYYPIFSLGDVIV